MVVIWWARGRPFARAGRLKILRPLLIRSPAMINPSPLRWILFGAVMTAVSMVALLLFFSKFDGPDPHREQTKERPKPPGEAGPPETRTGPPLPRPIETTPLPPVLPPPARPGIEGSSGY